MNYNLYQNMEVLFVIKVTLNILDACQLIIKYKNKICYIEYKREFWKKINYNLHKNGVKRNAIVSKVWWRFWMFVNELLLVIESYIFHIP